MAARRLNGAARNAATVQRLGSQMVGTMARSTELAMAAPLVIAARMLRMHDSALDPGQVENMRMVTEKIEAAVATGTPLLKAMVACQREVVRFYQEAAADGVRNAQRLARARSPVDAAGALVESWQTAAARAESAALRAGRAQAAFASGMLAPYHSRVAGNARRLGKRR